MDKNACLVKEIVLGVQNRVGRLADISRLLATRDINIVAVSGYAEAGRAKITVLTDKNAAAVKLLKKAGYKSIREKEVVVVKLKDKVGALSGITKCLANQGIDIKYIYGTTHPAGSVARLVISTSNNKKALALLKK